MTSAGEEAERRIEDVLRRGTEALDLGDLAFDKLPASLGHLTHLKSLSLGTGPFNEAGKQHFYFLRRRSTVSDLSAISTLTGLQNLDLSSTQITDMSALSGLAELRHLDLSSTRVNDLWGLSGLTGLWHLDLSFTQVTDLSALPGLAGLRHLDLSFTQVTDLSALSNLAGIQHLDPSFTQIANLSALSSLAELKHLNLSGTQVTDLSALSSLCGLQHLDLRHAQVTDLSALSSLTGLQHLDLNHTQVTDLSALSGLAGLQLLNLGRTHVTDLSTLSSLAGLQHLDISHTQITDLPVLSNLPGLQKLNIFGCPLSQPYGLLRDILDHPWLQSLIASTIPGVPREILSRNESDDCLPRLHSWHSELDQHAESDNEVKIILLGNGHVGKTQLCRRFRGEPFDTRVESTHGVQLWRESLALETQAGLQTFQVNWWDFGGQDIYHSTHALFLRSRAVFVLLWHPDLEQRKEFVENGIPMRNQPLAYWLDYVRSLAGTDSPVIVVQSQCDSFADRAADPPRPAGFGFFETCAYSAANDRGRGVLEQHLHEAIRYLQERSGATKIGHGRAEVRRRLYAWRSEDQQKSATQREHRTLSTAAFQSLCDEVGGIVSWQHALDYFHQTGVVFYRRDLFADGIILDQDWALDAVYAVFHRGRVVPWLRDTGRFTRQDLDALVWSSYSPAEQKLFLGLMQSCGVCFECEEAAAGEPRYAAPDLLPGLDRAFLPAWDDAAETVKLECVYRFFHPAIVRRLMQDVARKAKEKAEYWKFGVWFKDGQRNTQLRARFVDTSDAAAPGGGMLVLEAQGRDPLGLLAEIRRSLLRNPVGEPPEERLTLGGCTVAQPALESMTDSIVLAVDKRRVPAAPFVAFFDGKPIDASLTIHPERLNPADKRPEVFVSYAWGDDSPSGRARSLAVDALQSALEQDGFVCVRDRDQIQPGERISAFLRRLTRADQVVALVSDKYLRSPYCMYELYRLWQRAQTDPEQMLQRVLPVILPEVRLDNLVQRAPYMKHWAEQARTLEALARDPDLRPGSQSWEEVRLLREFAHHVDDMLVFINDVLMPCSLDDLVDGGFEAVLQALRRRRGGAD